MKLFYLSFLIFAVCIFTACNHKQEETEAEEGGIIKVKFEVVKLAKGSGELHYSGTVEPSQTIPLSFQSNGIVDQVMVEEGDIVRKGQLLATIDKADNTSIYNASIASYNRAKDAYDRLKSVHDNGSLTEIKWVEMETNLKQAESQMQLSKSNLEKCNMHAPENGMIGKRNIEPGQSSISISTPLELVKIEAIMVKIAVPENEISLIQKGQNASFSITALDGKTFEGVVTNVGVVANQISRTYDVKIKVKNTNFEMKPGMVCDVILNSGSKRNIMLVSYNTISKDSDGKPFVYLVSADGKTVKKHNISVGSYIDTGIEVLKGLSVGDKIVSEGKEKLSDNSIISY